jgi:hypothetical protein
MRPNDEKEYQCGFLDFANHSIALVNEFYRNNKKLQNLIITKAHKNLVLI